MPKEVRKSLLFEESWGPAVNLQKSFSWNYNTKESTHFLIRSRYSSFNSNKPSKFPLCTDKKPLSVGWGNWVNTTTKSQSESLCSKKMRQTRNGLITCAPKTRPNQETSQRLLPVQPKLLQGVIKCIREGRPSFHVTCQKCLVFFSTQG